MQILFDQGTPIGIKRFLVGHTVKTAYELGWSTLLNGELLRAAEAQKFDVFVTTDKNIAYQQNLRDRKIAIVVLGQARWKTVQTMMDEVIRAIETAEPGSYALVQAGNKR